MLYDHLVTIHRKEILGILKFILYRYIGLFNKNIRVFWLWNCYNPSYTYI